MNFNQQLSLQNRTFFSATELDLALKLSCVRSKKPYLISDKWSLPVFSFLCAFDINYHLIPVPFSALLFPLYKSKVGGEWAYCQGNVCVPVVLDTCMVWSYAMSPKVLCHPLEAPVSPCPSSPSSVRLYQSFS